MARQDEIIKERMRKIEELKEKKVELYAHSFDKKNGCAELQEKYKDLKPEAKTSDKVKTAGRVMTIRDIGKLIFADLKDGSGRIQLQLQEGETDEKDMDFFKKYIDMGDFIGVEGKIVRTKRGELSILADKVELLTKAILPLPEKWHGLQDKEERYRKRYLDLIMNSDTRKVFEVRAKIMKVLREFMEKNKFIEVETPLLQPVYGGAHAKPFMTHCDAFNSDLFLSIAPELYLKKALVGGFERVYEITKKFRNEGVDKFHNPEHMTIEWYQSYADYNDGMNLFEELMREIAKEVYGKTIIEYDGKKIDLKKWKRVPLLEAIKKYLNEDVSKVKNDEDAKNMAKKHGINADGITKINLPDELLKLFRENIIEPTFLIDYPIEMAPLAKPKKDDLTKAEIFQPIIAGMEIGRAYSELNDPKLQGEHFDEQEEERNIGNEEAMPADRDFVSALEYGMPPACGVGIGVERLVMLFTNSLTIRDVILFPFMKPESGREKYEKENT
ncbi:lysine--tRNA ligase [Candidatus Pacearchaeota archaeon]|nr:lysine--tRNA ligase [Candidatus Pacearchaeota archaeon]